MANTGDGNLRLARSNVIYAPGAPISRGKERDPYYGVLQKYIRDWDRVRVGVADKCFCNLICRGMQTISKELR